MLLLLLLLSSAAMQQVLQDGRQVSTFTVMSASWELVTGMQTGEYQQSPDIAATAAAAAAQHFVSLLTATPDHGSPDCPMLMLLL